LRSSALKAVFTFGTDTASAWLTIFVASGKWSDHFEDMLGMVVPDER
jgi:hypothetical protein